MDTSSTHTSQCSVLVRTHVHRVCFPFIERHTSIACPYISRQYECYSIVQLCSIMQCYVHILPVHVSTLSKANHSDIAHSIYSIEKRKQKIYSNLINSRLKRKTKQIPALKTINKVKNVNVSCYM